MKVHMGDASVWLPFTASAFALVFAIVILSDAGATVVFNGFGQDLSQSPTVMRYAIVHLTVGAALLAGGVVALIAIEARSRLLLLLGEAFAGAALAAIVTFERLSLWALPYLD